MHIFDRPTCIARDCRSLAARKSAYCADHVPVFYHDQNDRIERPCMVATWEEAKELKDLDAGKFENRGMSFRLHESRPVPTLQGVALLSMIPLTEGRNSCRKIGEGATALYRVKHFSYPVPAWGARNRPQYVCQINKVPEVPLELLAQAASLNQVQA